MYKKIYLWFIENFIKRIKNLAEYLLLAELINQI